MNKGQTHILKGIVYEYGDEICVADGEIVAQGCELHTIKYNSKTDELEFYSGDIEFDDYVEQLFPNESEMDVIYKYVTENF